MSIIFLFQNLDNSSVYINSIIVGASRIVAFLVAGPFVNMLGKKKLISKSIYIFSYIDITFLYHFLSKNYKNNFEMLKNWLVD